MMKETPESPRECSICERVEQTLRKDGGLSERLSGDEIEALVQRVQSAILNKSIEKNERGIKMSDEKYVISKASFEDFYETQDNLVSIIEKMVDRIEKQDQVIMKFGGALSELIAKAMDPMMMGEEPIEEDEDMLEEDVEEFDEDEESLEDEDDGLDEDEEIIEDDVEGDEEGFNADDLGMEGEMGEEELMGLIGKAEKAAFEAGWKANAAELKKQGGIPVNMTEIPSNRNRPVPSAERQVAQGAGQVNKSFSDAELAKLTPAQLNQMLKEQGY
jgi:hypothetical protein